MEDRGAQRKSICLAGARPQGAVPSTTQKSSQMTNRVNLTESQNKENEIHTSKEVQRSTACHELMVISSGYVQSPGEGALVPTENHSGLCLLTQISLLTDLVTPLKHVYSRP